MVDLGTLGADSSPAFAVNANGQVVGTSGHAFSWTQAGGMVDLGTLGGASTAIDVNANGQVVGYSDKGEPHAFSWTQAGGMVDLGILNARSTASAVNDRGQVVGFGNLDGSATMHAMVWQFASTPVANAGPSQTVHVGLPVILDGSGSSDPGGFTLTYQWSFFSKPAGSGASLSDPKIVNPTFTSDVRGDYVLQLIVTNSAGNASSPFTVTISTTNSPPVADAGADQSVIVIGTNVQLNGSQSYDLDGDAINYSWTLTSSPPGSTASLIGANTATPTFIAYVHGTYVAQLVVSDQWALSQPKTVTITFENVKPVANAQQSQSIPVGIVAFLDGSGSSDANHDPLTYNWTFVSLPTNSQSAISNPTASIASFMPDLPGTYIAQLIVNDGFVNSDSSTIQFQVFSTESAAIASVTDIQAAVSSLPDIALKNANMKKTLLNKLNAVIASIDASLYADALAKLQIDILGKMDGCATTGNPDKNDWLITCQAQNQVYPLVLETIWIIEGLLPK
jgi:probable HAF family extracellular repeat protein